MLRITNSKEGLTLPPEAVTQTFGILAMRGSGKSNAAVVMAEEMFEAGLHWVAVDPKGDWWGIRSSRDGKKPGLPVVILGGQHGDLPIDPSSGIFVADLIVDQHITCVIDLSEFTEGEKIRFMAGVGREDGFAARLYRRKSPDQPPTHLFFEEADDVLPQRVMRDKAKLLHDCSKLLLWGRQRGLGGTIITQRSARVHKDVLTQCATLIVLRTTSPQDRKAIEDWVNYHGQGLDLVKTLPELANGEAWIWSPEWLKKMERVKLRLRSTFDSGATPSIAKGKHPPATLADINLPVISEQMQAAIEKAKAEDPRELRRRIIELERELGKRKPVVQPVQAKPDTHALDKAEKHGFERCEKDFRNFRLRAKNKLEKASGMIHEILSTIETFNPGLVDTATLDVDHEVIPEPAPFEMIPRRSARQPEPGTLDGKLPGPQQRIIDSIAWLESIGIQDPEQTAVAFLAGYSYGGGAFNNPRGALRVAGLVDYLPGDKIRLTKEGRKASSRIEEPLTTEEMHRRVMARLPRPAQRILQVLIDLYPHSVNVDECARRSGYTPGAGAFNNPKGRLRTLGLIEYPAPGAVRARSILFLE